MLAMATGEANPRKVIQVQRARLYQDMHALTVKRSKTDPKTELAHILLLDSAVMHIEADLHWLEMVEARLDEIRSQPVPSRPAAAVARRKQGSQAFMRNDQMRTTRNMAERVCVTGSNSGIGKAAARGRLALAQPS
jgi:hypothetical protein